MTRKLSVSHITNHTIYAYELLYNIWMANARLERERKDNDNDNDNGPTDERRRNVT